MAKFRKRAPEVEAFRWDGGKELWPISKPIPPWITSLMRGAANELVIDRAHGYRRIAQIGDWVVVSDDDATVMTQNRFAATYEPVEKEFTPSPMPVRHGKTIARRVGNYEPKIRIEEDEADD